MKLNNTHIINVILICVLLGCSAAWIGASTTGIVSGVVKDADSGKPLSGVNVIVSGTNLSTVTDANGYYAITNVAPGDYEINADMVGYASKSVGGVQVTMDTTSTANISMSQEAIQEEAVVVTRPKPMIDTRQINTLNLVTSKQEELTRTDPINIHTAPGFLSALPGVQVEPDGSGQMHMRGGRYYQIGWYLEGIPITDPNTGAFGTNLFTTGASRFQAYTGGFGAEYGNAVSGTLNEVLKTGSELTGFNLDVQGGDQAFGNALVEFGGGTADTFNYYIGSALYQSDIDTPVIKSQKYTDNVAKLVWPSKNDTITVLAMQGSLKGTSDSYHTLGNNEESTPYEKDWLNPVYDVAAVTWSHNFSPKSFITVRPYYMYTKAINNLMGKYGMYNDVWSARTGMQVNYTNQLNEKHLVKMGGSLTHSDNNYYLYTHYYDDVSGSYLLYEPYHYQADVNTLQSDLYVEDNVKFNDKFTAQAGLRQESIKYDRTGKYFNGTDYSGADIPDARESRITPRLGISYSLDDRTAVKANWGKYTKFVPASSVQNVFFDPSTEASVSGLGATAPERSTAMEFSYEKQVSDSLSCRVTPFYTKYENMGDYYLDGGIVRYVNVGEGKSNGVELLMRKKLSDNWQGWFSYTYQRVLANRAGSGDINNFYYTSWDQRNTFALVASCKNGPLTQDVRVDFGSGRADLSSSDAMLNPEHAGPYAIFSYSLNLDLPKDSAIGSQVYLSVFNIFNNRQTTQYKWYSPVDRERDFWIPGRFVSFGVKKSF